MELQRVWAPSELCFPKGQADEAESSYGCPRLARLIVHLWESASIELDQFCFAERAASMVPDWCGLWCEPTQYPSSNFHSTQGC